MLDSISLVFNILFIIEFLIKVLAKGLFIHKNSYFRDGLNIIDFTVVFTTIIEISLIGGNSNLKAIKALRALRALRPLRSINAIPSMKKLINILAKSIPKLSTVLGLISYCTVAS